MAGETLYLDQLREIQQAIIAVENGESYAIGTRTYGSADLEELQLREERLSVQAAIQAIQEGAQAYSIRGRAFTKADLKTLYDRLDTLRDREARRARGGIRMRLGVPTE